MRFKGTDRKAVAAHVARSPVLADYARLYPATQERTVEILTGLAADYEAQGISVLIETSCDPSDQMARLRQSFDLTEAEARLALHVATGSSLKEFADARGVSRNTVRNQLQIVFQKTGVRRQANLVRLLQDI